MVVSWHKLDSTAKKTYPRVTSDKLIEDENTHWYDLKSYRNGALMKQSCAPQENIFSFSKRAFSWATPKLCNRQSPRR